MLALFIYILWEFHSEEADFTIQSAFGIMSSECKRQRRLFLNNIERAENSHG